MDTEKTIVKQKPNIFAFRYTPQEEVLMNQLKKDWQINNYSAVLHKILSSFYGVAVQRAEELAKVKAQVEKWQIQHHEVFGK